MKLKISKASVLVLALVLAVTSVATINAAPKYKFVLLASVTADPFWGPVKKGMDYAAKLLNVDATFTGPQEWNVRGERQMMDTLAESSNVDGIAVITFEPIFDEPIKTALARGIPVVAFNNDQPGSPRMAFMGQGEYEAGVVVGTNLKRFIPKGSRIFIGIHTPGQTAIENRKQGIIDALKDYDVTADVNAFAYLKPAEAMTALESYYSSHPDVKALCALSPQPGQLMAQWVVEKGLQQKIVVVSFDLLPRLLQYIQEGVVKFTIDQQPFMQGFYSVVQLYLYKEFGLAPKDINTGGAVIDKSNVDLVVALVKQGVR